MFDYSDSDKSDCTPTVYEQQQNNIEQLDKIFQTNLKLNSNISKQYPRLQSYQEIEDQVYKTGVPRNLTIIPRQNFDIQIFNSKAQRITHKTKDLLKRFKLIIKQISKRNQSKFNENELNLINNYCFSLHPTITQLGTLFGFQAFKNQHNTVVWKQKQGFDNINEVFLDTLDSFEIFSLIIHRKGTRKQNLQLIQSIQPLRDFLLNSFEQIEIQY